MFQILKIVALFLFVLSPLLNAGCLSQEMATAMGGAFDGVHKAIVDLEAEGVDYSVEAFVPTDFMVSWTPFGAELRLPNGYLRVNVDSGRGLGDRPPGIKEPPDEVGPGG